MKIRDRDLLLLEFNIWKIGSMSTVDLDFDRSSIFNPGTLWSLIVRGKDFEVGLMLIELNYMSFFVRFFVSFSNWCFSTSFLLEGFFFEKQTFT